MFVVNRNIVRAAKVVFNSAVDVHRQCQTGCVKYLWLTQLVQDELRSGLVVDLDNVRPAMHSIYG